MIVAGSASPLLLSSAGGYNLTKSLRFRSSASAYLNRTPASASNRRTWTWSAWVKRSGLGSAQALLAVNATTDYTYFTFNASDILRLFLDVDALGYAVEVPTVVWRDPSAWYHIILAMDTTQATAGNRVKIYVNGVQQTVSAISGFSFPAQNWDTDVNSTLPHAIGNFNYLNSAYFDGYMTEVYLIDGQALTPSSFGQTSSTTGVWQPIRYTGTYGTNGFYLPFTDVATTSGSNAGLGKDFSGNGNYWTTNNISVTSGTTYDSMSDVPTLTSATTANYAVMNPLNKASLVTVTDGNLTLSPSSASWGAISGTVAVTSGKWYYEYSASISNPLTMCGWATTDEDVNTTYGSSVTKQWVMYLANGNKYGNGSNAVSYASAVSANTVVGVALDMDAGTLTFYIGGVSQGTAFSTGLSGKTLVPWIPVNSGAGAFSGYANFGQRPFTYTPPTGFVALNTFNLSTPTIGATASTVANKYFDAALYTGTGSSQTISSLNFSPDFVWIKERSADRNHRLQDSVRGANKSLRSNGTQAEATDSADGYVSAFTSNGFTTAAGSNSILDVGESSGTYVAWCWDANGSGSTNTAGSITSTVSANTTAGFSVATYTGNGSTGATIGHGLGVTPSMVIVKKRSSTGNWITYHTSTGINQYLYLNSTAAAATASPTWGVSSTTITFQQAFSDYNDSGVTYVAYCFAQVAGYSAFGSYTGNGSSNGPFIYLGFRPKYLLIFNITTGTGEWLIQDSVRDPYNYVQYKLAANRSVAENDATYIGTSTQNTFDFLSNGFKARTSNGNSNGSSNTYIYMAFAESPFKYANAR